MENETSLSFPNTSYSSAYIMAGAGGFVLLVENVLTMATIWRTPALRCNENVFVFSLAITDGAVGLNSITYCCVLAAKIKGFSEYYNWMRYLTWILLCISAVHLALVALDRALCVAKPFFYERRITRRVTLKVVMVTWGTSLGVSAILVAISVERGELDDKLRRALPESLLLYPGTIVFIFSFVIVLVAYVIILRIALLQRAAIASLQISDQNGGRRQQSWRVVMKSVKFLLVVCGVFFLSMTYFVVVTIVNYFQQVANAWISTSFILAGLNSAMNTLIYAAMNKTFRRAYKKTVCDVIKIPCPCIRNRDEVRAVSGRGS